MIAGESGNSYSFDEALNNVTPDVSLYLITFTKKLGGLSFT